MSAPFLFPVLAFKATNINGKVTGTTNIFQNVDLNQFYLLSVIIIGEDIAGFTSGPTLSFGGNASANDTIAATTITIPDAVSYVELFPKSFSAAIVQGTATDTFKVNVTVAAVATTYKFKVLALGFNGPQGAE